MNCVDHIFIYIFSCRPAVARSYDLLIADVLMCVGSFKAAGTFYLDFLVSMYNAGAVLIDCEANKAVEESEFSDGKDGTPIGERL
jgi:hypothetical protein